MKEPPTGEPYAGEPPMRFGGRGWREPFPTPIKSPRFSEFVIVHLTYYDYHANFSRSHLVHAKTQRRQGGAGPVLLCVFASWRETFF